MNSILILVFGDMLLSAAAVYAGAMIRFGANDAFRQFDFLQMLIFVGSSAFISNLLELYNMEKHIAGRELLLRILIGIAGTFLTISAVSYLLHVHMFFRGMLVATLFLFGLFQYLWHIGFVSFMNAPGLARRVLVLGTGPLAQKIGELILNTNHQHILRGYINLSGESVQVPSEAIIESGSGLLATVQEENVHKVVVSLSERRGIFPLRDVMDCKFSGVEVIDAPTFYEEITGKLLIENTMPSWFIFSNGFKMNARMRLYKRTMDVILSVIGLALTLPLLPVVALVIKIDSRGPIFFRQVRVGAMEKEFVLYKFRTMRQDAEQGTGAVWAKKNDSRVTRIGALFRKIRIDELPQLFNVLQGNMSFVGPRPERPEFIKELKKQIPYYSERHFVKPGVTGWAQIRYPYGASVEDTVEKLRYDLFYIKNISLFLDLQILFETVKVMLIGKGAR